MKKPHTAYITFCTMVRPRIRAENPEAKFGDIGRKLGAAWRSDENAELKKRLKREYDAKMKAYRAAQVDEM